MTIPQIEAALEKARKIHGDEVGCRNKTLIHIYEDLLATKKELASLKDQNAQAKTVFEAALIEMRKPGFRG